MKTTLTQIASQILAVVLLFVCIGDLSSQGSITCPNDGFISVVADTNQECGQVLDGLIATLSSDICSNPNPSHSINGSYMPGLDASGQYFIGTTTVVFFTGCEVGAVCTLLVEVLPPPIQCMFKDTVLHLDAGGFAFLAPNELDLGTTDGCSSFIELSGLQEGGYTCDDIGMINTTITATGEFESSVPTDCPVTLTVQDSISPICNAVASDSVYLDASGMATLTAAEIDNGSTDNCTIQSIQIDKESFDCTEARTSNNIAAIDVTLTVTDQSGNSSSCISEVFVFDTIPPVCVAKDTTVTYDPAMFNEILPSEVDGGSTDNCEARPSTLGDFDSFQYDCSNVGVNSVVLAVVDPSGNRDTCTSTITVIAPAGGLTCDAQDITVPLDAAGNAMIIASDVDNGSTSACGNVNLSVSPDMFDCTQIGANTVTLTVSDDFGNSTTCAAVVTVEDDMDPTCNAQDVTVYLDESGEAVIDLDSLANNQQLNGLNRVMTNFGKGPAFIADINLDGSHELFINRNGDVISLPDEGNFNYNENSSNQTIVFSNTGYILVNIMDLNGDTYPELILTNGSSTQVIMNNSGTLDMFNPITFSGFRYLSIFDYNGDGFVDLIGAINSNDINVLYNDGLGQFTSQVTFTPSVFFNRVILGDFDGDNDTDLLIRPNTFSGNYILLENNINQFTELTTPFSPFQHLEVCDVDNDGDLDYITQGSNPSQHAISLNDGTSLPNYGSASTFQFMSLTSIIEFSIYEANGKFFSIIPTKKVIQTDFNGDNDDDLLVTVSPGFVSSDGSIYVSQNAPPGFTDNCTVQSVTLSQDDFDCTSLGTPTDVTITVTDQSGNTSECTSMVTVLDTLPPTCNTQDITINLQNGIYTLDPMEVDNGSTDNCDVMLAVSPNTFDCTDIGSPVTVTLTATDPSGNTSTCTAEVTVESSAMPTCVTQDITINLDANGMSSYIAADIDDGSSVECGAVTFSATPTSFDCSQIGTNPVMLTVMDDSGNSSTCPATVTVVDTIAPICMTQDITVNLDEMGMASIVASDVYDEDICAENPIISRLGLYDRIDDPNDTGNVGITLIFGGAPPYQFIDWYNASDNSTIPELGNDSLTSPDLRVGDYYLLVGDVNGCQHRHDFSLSILNSFPGNTIDEQLPFITNSSLSQIRDNCSIQSIDLSQDKFTCADIGLNQITVTVTDASGNTSQCTANVTVQDTLAPQCPVNADLVVQLEAGQCDTAYVFDLPTAIDNCDPNPMSIAIPGQPMSGDTFAIGTHTIQYIVSDNNPNCNTNNSLIPNPTFEMLAPGASPPDDNSQLDRADSWEQATQATSDYFNVNTYPNYTTASAGLVVTNNPPPNGSEYWVGGATLGPRPQLTIEDYVEYVGTTLTTPLVANTPYKLDMLLGAGISSNFGDLDGDIVVLGIPVGMTFPISGYDCKEDDFSVIGSLSVNIPEGTWQNVQIDILPDANYPRIMFGIGCNTMLSNDEAYFLADDLILTEASNCIGNTDTCSFDIEVLEHVPDGLACRERINLSLDPLTCSGFLTPDMILTSGDLGCVDSCKITLKDEHGHALANNFDYSHAGKVFTYEVCCAGVCCWGEVLVEYKAIPVIDCPSAPILVACTAADMVPAPDVSDNCSNAAIERINQVQNNYTCDTNYIGEVVNTYQIRNDNGELVGDICRQTILLERIDLNQVVWPDHLIGQRAQACPDGVDVQLTGVPTYLFDGRLIEIYPEVPTQLCNVFVTFEDETVIESNCKRRIQRLWTVGEWWCTDSPLRTYTQIIDEEDIFPPRIIVPTKNILLETTGAQCIATTRIDLPIVDDVCSEEGIKFNLTIDGNTYTDYKGGSIDLSIGQYVGTWDIIDRCGNAIDSEFNVDVRDGNGPIPLCDGFTTISLKSDGLAFLTPEMIDDGSFDACSEVQLDIRRMFDNCNLNGTAWSDKLYFCCEDQEAEVMVALRVTDAVGNQNTCMAMVEVQDKVAPTLTCPNDTAVVCTTNYDLDRLNSSFGEARATGNCPDIQTIVDEVVGNTVSSCQTGVITRSFTLLNRDNEQISNCRQTITLFNDDLFSEDDIKWPPAEVTLDQCTDREIGVDISGEPTWQSDACELIAVRYDDQEFDFAGNPDACKKVVRTWTIIDWCQLNANGNYEEFTFVQTILVNDLIDPIIEKIPVDSVYCSFSNDCDDYVLEGTMIKGSDSCTDTVNLKWTATVYNSEDEVVRTFSTIDSVLSIDGVYSIGEYRVDYILEDRCGNSDRATSQFEVRSCKAPTAYCINGLSTSLVEMTVDTGNAWLSMLTPDFFDAGSGPSCSDEFVLSFSEDVSDTLLVLSCQDLGDYEVSLTVTDEFGNTAQCITTILVEDNDGGCGMRLDSDISGIISTEEGDELSGMDVRLQGVELDVDITDDQGIYMFENVPNRLDYQVSPYNDEDHIAGVSTRDLILIQRHILRMKLLDSPYKLIAADINRDDKITAADLVTLRKLILGIDDRFIYNTSWRFVDKSFEFPEPRDPWLTLFPEICSVTDLSVNRKIDFVASKIGDVDGSIIESFGNPMVNTRSAVSSELHIKDFSFEGDELLTIPFYLKDDQSIGGFQISLDVTDLEIISVESDIIGSNELDYHVNENGVKIIGSLDENHTIAPDQPLFYVVLRSNNYENIQSRIDLAEYRNESYHGDNLNPRSVELVWDEDKASNDKELTVEQNRPNPWQLITTISFKTSDKGQVKLTIYDMNGRSMAQQHLYHEGGKGKFVVNKDELNGAGIYLYEILFQDEVVRNKMILIE